MGTIVLTKAGLENSPCTLKEAWGQIYKYILEYKYNPTISGEGNNEYVLYLDCGQEHSVKTYYLASKDFIILQ
jgi:hypothetical protein